MKEFLTLLTKAREENGKHLGTLPLLSILFIYGTLELLFHQKGDFVVVYFCILIAIILRIINLITCYKLYLEYLKSNYHKIYFYRGIELPFVERFIKILKMEIERKEKLKKLSPL